MIWQLYCCLTLLCVYQLITSYQPPSGYLSVTWSASGRSARDLRRQQAQGVPSSPKSCLPSATGLGTFRQSPKAAGTFRGPLPPFLRAASPYSSFRAKKQALCRPERCAAQVPACLSTVEPPLPGSQVFGAGTLPVGFQGRSALVAKGEISVRRTCIRRIFGIFFQKRFAFFNFLCHNYNTGIKHRR